MTNCPAKANRSRARSAVHNSVDSWPVGKAVGRVNLAAVDRHSTGFGLTDSGSTDSTDRSYFETPWIAVRTVGAGSRPVRPAANSSWCSHRLASSNRPPAFVRTVRPYTAHCWSAGNSPVDLDHRRPAAAATSLMD